MSKSNEQYALCVKDYGQRPDVLSLFIAGKKSTLYSKLFDQSVNRPVGQLVSHLFSKSAGRSVSRLVSQSVG